MTSESAQGDRSEPRWSYSVALFLLELWARCGEDLFLAAARRALDHDLHGATETALGTAWGRFEGDHLVEPYWLHGSSGIGTVVTRFARVLGEERYRATTRAIARSLCVGFSIMPGQFEGMSGIAEFLLDAADVLEAPEFRAAALDLADTILWYAVPHRGGILFPGGSLQRLTGDFATGAAGVAAFFHRLCHGGPRFLVDLPGLPRSSVVSPATRS